MHEPDFFNNTPFAAEIVPYVDAEGCECRLVVFKASYALGGVLPHPLLEEQRPVRLGNEPWGDPKVADYKYPSDLCAFKPGTDVLVAGHAVSATGRPVAHIDVVVSFAGRTRHLRAHGPRRWQLGAMQVGIGLADPAERIPMRWALAYGGLDASAPDKPVECKENPVGSGVSGDPTLLHGQPAPQIEDPSAPIRTPNQGVPPVGLGPLGPNFEPRRSLAGSYDKHWLDAIHPAKPRDYKPAFENVAPREFVFETQLRGNEEGAIHGMSADGPLSFRVPVERPWVEWTIDGKLDRKEPHLDTVLVDTDDKAIELVWRVCIRTPSKMRNRFTLVQVYRKEPLER